MKTTLDKTSTIKEILFYILGGVLIAGFILLYFPRFLGIGMLPPAIRYLFYQLGPAWAIGVNAGVFILFLVFLPYRTKMEWRSKGTFSAFILALMAEMFGIPLLLYILSPIMRISYYARHEGGWLNNPLIFGWTGAVVGVWLTLIGMIIVIIGWHQIHRAKGLVTTGLYKYIRHPQYTGFFLLMTGWLLHWETTLTLVMYPILVVMYFFLARREDKELRNEFGVEYAAYRQRTPMFLPIRWNLTRILAIIGTLLVWIPILAPIGLAVAEHIRVRLFQFDYLMPAELFPLVLVGGGLLLWAALRRRARRGWIGWGLGSAVGLMLSVQVLAVLTGLASGETGPGGWQWALVISALVGYILAVVVIGIGGVLLLRDLFKTSA